MPCGLWVDSSESSLAFETVLNAWEQGFWMAPGWPLPFSRYPLHIVRFLNKYCHLAALPCPSEISLGKMGSLKFRRARAEKVRSPHRPEDTPRGPCLHGELASSPPVVLSATTRPEASCANRCQHARGSTLPEALHRSECQRSRGAILVSSYFAAMAFQVKGWEAVSEGASPDASPCISLLMVCLLLRPICKCYSKYIFILPC